MQMEERRRSVKYATLWLPDDIAAISIVEIRGYDGNLTMDTKMFGVEQINAGTLNATNEKEARDGQT